MKKIYLKFRTKLILLLSFIILILGLISIVSISLINYSSYKKDMKLFKEKSLQYFELAESNLEEEIRNQKNFPPKQYFEKLFLKLTEINTDLKCLSINSISENAYPQMFTAVENKMVFINGLIKLLNNMESTASQSQFIKEIDDKNYLIIKSRVKQAKIPEKARECFFIFHSDLLDKNITNDIIFIIFLISSLIVLGIIFTFYLSNKLAKPLMKLKRAAEIISDGNLDYKINISSNNEVGELATSLNVMAKKLKNSFLKMQLHIDTVESLIQERTKQLQQAYDEIQERNSALHRELTMASRVQQAILPKEITSHLPVKIDSVYLAMEAIGGDFFDILKINDEKLSFLISDVTGHGISAALVTTMTKLAFINYARLCETTQETCEKVNAELYQYIHETRIFVSAFYIVYDKKENLIQYTNCGHQYALHYKMKSGEVETLDSKGFVLGAFDFSEYGFSETKVESGDKILMFTDGVTEARNKEKKFFSKETLTQIYKENGHLEPAKINEVLFLKLMEFTQDVAKTDDITFLTFEIV